MTLDEVLSRFDVKKRTGKGAMCRCPCHADDKASLSISQGDDGRILLYDFAKCSTGDILSKVGLKLADLYPDQTDSRQGWQRYIEGREQRQIEAVYPYRNAFSGDYEFSRLRLCGKAFIYGILKNDRFNYGLQGRKRKDVPAIFTESVKGLQEAVKAGERIFYCEGEKDVQTLQKHGYKAFTCGGSSDWVPACAELMRGANVVLCGDNDVPGRELMCQVGSDLQGVAASVKTVFPDQSRKGADVTDFFDAGGTKDQLDAMIDAVPDEKPKEAVPAGSQADLMQFHLVNEKGKVTGVFDLAIFEFLKNREDLFILGGCPFIYRDGAYHADSNGAELKTMIRALIMPEFVKSTTIKRVYDLFTSAAELQVSFDQVNDYPAWWINFRNGFYDPVSRKMIPHDPKYHAVNQVPHDFKPDAVLSGDGMEKWLQFAIEDPADREMILQFVGLCLTRDCRQQKFMILCGEGGTGKSTLIRLMETAVGADNVANIALSELSQRFASFGLMGKLLNSCADLEIGALEDTSVLKKALGEDTLRAEQKGHDAVSFKNYARMIFSTNELPLVKAERTNGFYRRLTILTMNRVPTTERADLFDSLSAEIDYFIRLSVDALGRMYQAGKLSESPHSVEAVKRLRCESDTVEAFIADEAQTGQGLKTDRTILYKKYEQYCIDMDRQSLSRFNFYKALKSKGYPERVIQGRRFIGCISLDKSAPVPAPTSAPKGAIVVQDIPLPFD